MAQRRGGGAGAAPGSAGDRGGRRPGRSAPSARTTTRVPPPEAPVGPGRRTAFTKRALVLLLVLAVLGVSYASSIRAWLNLRSQHNTLAAQIADQKQAISELEAAKGRWQDPAFVEAQARLRFGWVLPGERGFRVIGKDGRVIGAKADLLSTPPATGSTTRPPWWQGAVDSLATADSPPVVKKPTKPERRPATRIGADGSARSGGTAGSSGR